MPLFSNMQKNRFSYDAAQFMDRFACFSINIKMFVFIRSTLMRVF